MATNVSGVSFHIATSYYDGHIIEGLLEDGVTLWAGNVGAPISSASVQAGDVTHTFSADALRTPLPGDNRAAFVIRKEGIKKVKFDVALSVTRDR